MLIAYNYSTRPWEWDPVRRIGRICCTSRHSVPVAWLQTHSDSNDCTSDLLPDRLVATTRISKMASHQRQNLRSRGRNEVSRQDEQTGRHRSQGADGTLGPTLSECEEDAFLNPHIDSWFFPQESKAKANKSTVSVITLLTSRKLRKRTIALFLTWWVIFVIESK